MDIARTIAFVADVFKDKFDKGGQAYILHCLRVANAIGTKDVELYKIALLHDVIEDSEYKLEDLIKMGYSLRVVEAVSLLTHKREIPYMEYVERLSINPDAVRVKLADLEDNSKITRLKGITKRDISRMQKYHTAYTYLSNA